VRYAMFGDQPSRALVERIMLADGAVGRLNTMTSAGKFARVVATWRGGGWTCLNAQR